MLFGIYKNHKVGIISFLCNEGNLNQDKTNKLEQLSDRTEIDSLICLSTII